MFVVEWWGEDWIGILRLKCLDLHKILLGATKKKEQQLLVGLDMHNAV